MDISKSFSYQFEDKQWISKLGITALITLVPILNFALAGYMVGLMRNVMDNSSEPLPNWDDLGKKFIDGLILAAARLIYLLPLIIIFMPIIIIAFSGIISGNKNLQDVGKLMAGAGGILLVGVICLLVIYAFALSVVFPVIEIIFARKGTFASCFNLREAYDLISRNSGPFFTAWLVYIVSALVIGFAFGIIGALLGWIPCLGWIVSIVLTLGSSIYILTIFAYLFGQFGQIAFGQKEPLG